MCVDPTQRTGSMSKKEVSPMCCRPATRSQWMAVVKALKASDVPFAGRPFERVKKYTGREVVKITSGQWWEGSIEEGEVLSCDAFIDKIKEQEA